MHSVLSERWKSRLSAFDGRGGRGHLMHPCMKTPFEIPPGTRPFRISGHRPGLSHSLVTMKYQDSTECTLNTSEMNDAKAIFCCFKHCTCNRKSLGYTIHAFESPYFYMAVTTTVSRDVFPRGLKIRRTVSRTVPLDWKMESSGTRTLGHTAPSSRESVCTVTSKA